MTNSEPEFKASYLKHSKLFNRFSDPRLVTFYNLQVGKNESELVKEGMIAALREEFYKRRIDYSTILDDDLKSLNNCVIMVGKKLYKITELPPEVTEGLVMMQLKSKDQDFRAIKILECNEDMIHYSLNGLEHNLTSNEVIRFFTSGLLNPVK
jgi:hypothetical protein